MSLDPGIEIAVFDAASRIDDPAERKAFIDWAFRDSPEEGRRMNAILCAEDEAQSWLRRAEDSRADLSKEIAVGGSLQLPMHQLESAEIDDLSQSVAPRYTILRLIGGGSSGQVYLAEQLQPVRRMVAIKLLRSELESPAFVAAFQREQQILAAMNHPSIAAILDAGATTSGRPFLVMEFVEGTPITTYCNTYCLTLRQRLDLFLEVCSAIQHAHQKGIIHRDIKPGNILIAHGGSRPLPKVIDFGVASIGEWSSESRFVAGTPSYMSPEQIAGGYAADTLVDVFSLGVVLYELLAGRPPWSPHRLREATLPASERLAGLPGSDLEALAGCRQLKPRELIARVRGDLDSIVAKAIALDRRQRYDTVDALASDLRRHVGCFPVTARPASFRYVARCFLARNRLACSAFAAVLLAMTLGIVVSVNFFLRERAARKDSQLAQARTAALLDQASARENITRVAILLEQKQIEAADALLQQTPISTIAPSTEAAYVFRLLGERNALLGRWKQASECYGRLMMANRLVPAERVVQSGDFMFGGPAILEGGEVDLYDALRKDMLARLPDPPARVTAEHVVKGCMLTPADRAILDALRPMADQLRPKGRGHNTSNESLAAATVLFDLRDGRFQSAYEGADRTLRIAKTPSFRARLLILRAMAAHALGKSDAARSDLEEASTMIQQVSSRVIVEDQGAYDASQGSWAAWAIARILHREATASLAR